MTAINVELSWEPQARLKYDTMIRRIPFFHRDIARQVVERKAVLNAAERGSKVIEESDILRAFFSEVPKAFYSLMIRLFEEVGFNYRLYEQQ